MASVRSSRSIGEALNLASVGTELPTPEGHQIKNRDLRFSDDK
jgi:hypothetical protein